MEIYISIDGVIRNTIQKFDYHYNDAYLTSEFENEEKFEYGVIEPIQNDNLLNHYNFQSQEEFEFFTFMEYPIEIFGHAGLSYSTTFTDLPNSSNPIKVKLCSLFSNTNLCKSVNVVE